MAKFKDSKGTEWEFNLDVGLIEDIQEKTSVNLDDIMKNPEELAKTIFLEPRKMVEVLYVCCEKQIEERKLTPRDFGRLFNRDTIDNASNAFIEALMLFYPRSSAGRVIGENMPHIIGKLDRDLEKKMRENLAKVLSDTSTN